MVKKLTLLAAAIAVVAFAIPAAASAAPSVTSSAGVLAPVGTVITGTSSNTKTQTELGLLTCTNVTVTGKITKNSGTSVEAVSNGKEGTTKGCEVEGSALTITDPTLINLTSTVDTKGSVTLTFIADLLGISCHFSGTVPFTYKDPTDTINVASTSSPALTGSPAICGNASSFKGDFTLTIGTTPVILD
jgi:hypothetical protein